MEDVTFSIAEPDADGICMATVLHGSRQITRFETTKAEAVCLGFLLAEMEPPPKIAAEAREARDRRIALRRTACTEERVHVTRFIPPPIPPFTPAQDFATGGAG